MTRKRGLVGMALGCTLGLMSCVTSPTGRRQFLLLPDDQVAALGATAFEDLKKNEKLTTDSKLKAYVDCIADAIIDANRDQLSGQWEIVTFENEQVNAFALPGGKIGVYSGLAKFAENPAQLATVVGHEIGHVIARHGNERMSQALAAQGGLGLVAAYEGGGETKEMLLAALGIGYDLGVAKPFSRTQEAEADEIGTVMMAKAGFNPREAVLLWRKMATHGTAIPEFLSTHPSPESRVQALTGLQPTVQPLYVGATKRPRCIKP